MKGLAFKAPSGVLLHPQPKVPRGILEPRSAGANPCLGRGSHWGADGPPTLSGLLLVVVLGLNLLLLLECWLGLFGHISLRQPQPDLRHVGEGNPRVAVSKRARHLQALLCATPILVCPAHRDYPCPSAC